MILDVWHNLLWSRYKAVVFTQLHREAAARGVQVNFFQIAETASDRVGLSGVDLAAHQYPYINLFKGSYSAIPKLKLYAALANRVWTTQADLVLLDGYSRIEHWLQALILKARRRKFMVICDSTIHDQTQSRIKGLLKRVIFALSDGAFCYGSRSAEYLARYGMAPHKIFHRCQAAALPLGYDPAAIITARLAAAPPPEKPVFLYVGRLASVKGLPTLLEAFAKLLPARPAARLVLIGTGPEQPRLAAQAATLGIQSNIDFAGAKSGRALWDAYLAATCLVLPSESEPWGLVVNEALSHGCPVLVSDHCGCAPELVAEGTTGATFHTGDPADLAAKLADMPGHYADITTVAKACLTQIAPYTPESAARAMLNGMMTVLNPTPPALRSTKAVSA
jgi:glycosyltransferase involved in cell wall biosynthesis